MQEINVLNVTVNNSSSVVRHVFVKPLASDTEKKSVILVNLPCFCDPKSFEKLIKEKFGDVKSISYHSCIEKIGFNENTFDGPDISPLNGFRVAVVRFKNKTGFKSLYDLIESQENLCLYGDGKPITGIKRWEKSYNDSVLNIKSFKEGIAHYVAAYDKKVERERERAKAMEGIPDEDGWIKVTRHGKKTFLPNTEAIDQKITEQMQRKRAKVEGFPYINKIRNDPL